jgi:hypothetical protein
MYGAYGVLAALIERARTGIGTVVRTSLLSAVVGVHGFQSTRWTIAGQVGRAQGNHHASIAPYGLFHCADGFVQIAVGSEGLWRRFCTGFGLDPATPGLETNGQRVPNRDRLIELVEGVFADWKAQELLDRLDEIGVPAGKVRTIDEVYAWEQTRSQGLLIDVEHETLGRLQLPGPPLRFFDPNGREVTRTAQRRRRRSTATALMPKLEALAAVKGERLCTNDDLIRNTAYNWSPMSAAEITDKTGIESRVYSARPLEDLALQAAEAALQHAGRRPEEIGAVLVATCTSTGLMPSLATWLSGQLGMQQRHASCDIVAACAGLPYGLAEATGCWRRSNAPSCWSAPRSSPTRSARCGRHA